LRLGVNFINFLRAAFTREDPESAKHTDNLTVFYALLGSARVKAAVERSFEFRLPGMDSTKLCFYLGEIPV